MYIVQNIIEVRPLENYYIYLTLSNNLSKRESEEKIKNNEYERILTREYNFV